LRPVLPCCLASPSQCPNCDGHHSASFRESAAHPPPPPPKAAPPAGEAPSDSPVLPPADVDMDDLSGARPQTALQDPPALGPAFQFETPRAHSRQSGPPRSRSVSRHGFAPPEGQSSPSPL